MSNHRGTSVIETTTTGLDGVQMTTTNVVTILALPGPTIAVRHCQPPIQPRPRMFQLALKLIRAAGRAVDA